MFYKKTFQEIIGFLRPLLSSWDFTYNDDDITIKKEKIEIKFSKNTCTLIYDGTTRLEYRKETGSTTYVLYSGNNRLISGENVSAYESWNLFTKTLHTSELQSFKHLQSSDDQDLHKISTLFLVYFMKKFQTFDDFRVQEDVYYRYLEKSDLSFNGQCPLAFFLALSGEYWGFTRMNSKEAVSFVVIPKSKRIGIFNNTAEMQTLFDSSFERDTKKKFVEFYDPHLIFQKFSYDDLKHSEILSVDVFKEYVEHLKSMYPDLNKKSSGKEEQEGEGEGEDESARWALPPARSTRDYQPPSPFSMGRITPFQRHGTQAYESFTSSSVDQSQFVTVGDRPEFLSNPLSNDLGSQRPYTSMSTPDFLSNSPFMSSGWGKSRTLQGPPRTSSGDAPSQSDEYKEHWECFRNAFLQHKSSLKGLTSETYDQERLQKTWVRGKLQTAKKYVSQKMESIEKKYVPTMQTMKRTLQSANDAIQKPVRGIMDMFLPTKKKAGGGFEYEKVKYLNVYGNYLNIEETIDRFVKEILTGIKPFENFIAEGRMLTYDGEKYACIMKSTVEELVRGYYDMEFYTRVQDLSSILDKKTTFTNVVDHKTIVLYKPDMQPKRRPSEGDNADQQWYYLIGHEDSKYKFKSITGNAASMVLYDDSDTNNAGDKQKLSFQTRLTYLMDERTGVFMSPYDQNTYYNDFLRELYSLRLETYRTIQDRCAPDSEEADIYHDISEIKKRTSFSSADVSKLQKILETLQEPLETLRGTLQGAALQETMQGPLRETLQGLPETLGQILRELSEILGILIRPQQEQRRISTEETQQTLSVIQGQTQELRTIKNNVETDYDVRNITTAKSLRMLISFTKVAYSLLDLWIHVNTKTTEENPSGDDNTKFKKLEYHVRLLFFLE